MLRAFRILPVFTVSSVFYEVGMITGCAQQTIIIQDEISISISTCLYSPAHVDQDNLDAKTWIYLSYG